MNTVSFEAACPVSTSGGEEDLPHGTDIFEAQGAEVFNIVGVEDSEFLN